MKGWIVNSFACQGIKKHFKGVKALQGASLDIKAGEIRALFGGNGSGKSTLAKILGGVLAPDEGEILIDGKTVPINSPQAAKAQGIVVTSQELSLFYNTDIASNIMFNTLPTRRGLFMDRRRIEEEAAHSIDRFNLRDSLNIPVSELPDNKKYLVEFAKALMQKPKLLIIDEVTSALFLQDFEIVRTAIFELSEQGIPVIYISHRMSEIFNVCKAVTVMRNGVTVGTYDLSGMPREELLRLMTGEEKGEEGPQTEVASPAPAAATAAAGHPALRVKDLDLTAFGKRISLAAQRGEFIGFSGLQGQGQSELIRTLFGMRGHVSMEIMGTETSFHTPLEAIRRGIGFLSGNREIEGSFSERPVRENMDVVHSYVLGRGGMDFAATVKEYNIVVDSPNQPIKSLSGGNQQKVIISRWTGVKPKILLADDPTKGVDVQARREVHQIIRGLVNAGTTVLMSSSDDEELVDIASLIPMTRILIFYMGEIIETLRGDQITVARIVSSSLAKGAVRT